MDVHEYRGWTLSPSSWIADRVYNDSPCVARRSHAEMCGVSIRHPKPDRPDMLWARKDPGVSKYENSLAGASIISWRGTTPVGNLALAFQYSISSPEAGEIQIEIGSVGSAAAPDGQSNSTRFVFGLRKLPDLMRTRRSL